MHARFKIVNGTFVYENKKQAEWVANLLASFNNTGKYLEMNIKEYSRGTTEKQYNLFRAMVAMLKNESGMTYSESEKSLYDKFSPKKTIKDFLEKEHFVPMNVMEMDHKQYQDFLIECSHFLKEFFDLDFEL